MTSWQDPKTNWVATDYYNYTDYNRQVGNLLVLKDMADQVYSGLEFLGMVEDKNYLSMLYASEFNAIESNLKTLNEGTYNYPIGEKKTYYPNQATPNFEEFNRIESAELRLFYSLYGQISILRHTSFTLGGAKPFAKRVKYAKNEIISHRMRYRLGSSKGDKF